MMSVAGQTKVASPGMASFQDFVLSTLTAAPNVVSAKTYVTIRSAKREPGVPVGLEGAVSGLGEVASLTAIGREADLVGLVDKPSAGERRPRDRNTADAIPSAISRAADMPLGTPRCLIVSSFLSS